MKSIPTKQTVLQRNDTADCELSIMDSLENSLAQCSISDIQLSERCSRDSPPIFVAGCKNTSSKTKKKKMVLSTVDKH